MRWVCVLRDSQRLPAFDVVMSNTRVVGGNLKVVGQVANDSHSLDTDNAFQCQVGLVAVKIISSDRESQICTYAKEPAKSSVEI